MTLPEVGGKSPVMALNNVVLPAPLAPSTARRSPAATENDTSSIAFKAPNARVTLSSTRASPEASGFTDDGSDITAAMGSYLSRACVRVTHSRTVRHIAQSRAH